VTSPLDDDDAPGVGGAGLEEAPGLGGAGLDAWGREGRGRARGPWTVEIALATCDPFTSSAARAAALGRLSLSMPKPGGEVSCRFMPGLLLSLSLAAPPNPVPAPKRAGAPFVV